MLPPDTDQDDATLCPVHEAGAQPLPGYRLLALLGKGGTGEVWKCEAPGGLLKAIKFVHGGLGLDAPAEEELQAIQRIKDIRHPFLLSLERVERTGRELAIVMELADRHLGEVLAAEQRAGRPGIARDRLLGYLREAAEVLDLMNQEHGLQHLDVKPHNLFLVADHVKVGDFGLVNGLTGSEPGQAVGPRSGAMTPLYAAPELFENAVSPHCDQYSLAIVYQELLTGTLPFTGKNARQLMLQHLREAPDLAALPAGDREVVARALSKVPGERFASCSDFVTALAAGSAPPPPREPLADLRLLDCVRRTPLSEVYRAQTADGSERQVTMLFGCAGRAEEMAGRLAALRHPVLAPVHVVRDGRGGLALVGLPNGPTLRDRWQECVAAGLPGMPRGELLAHLKTAASALDFLFRTHGVAHLGLNPRNLLVTGGRLYIADFGLAQLLWLPAGQAVARLNVRYSAPELFQRQHGPACDQYSLALIYHEMLTGNLPVFARHSGPPSLEHLPPGDAAVLARALAPDPARRWDNCTSFVRALEAPDAVSATTGPAPPAGVPLPTRLGTPLTAEQVRGRLEVFCRQWKGAVLGEESGCLVAWLPLPRGPWQRWTGRQPALEVRIRLGTMRLLAGPAAEVQVEVRPHDAGPGQGDELVELLAPMLAESVRTALLVCQRGRQQERVAWPHLLQVSSVERDGSLGQPVECRGKDISPRGIGFFLPGELPSARLSLRLPETPQTPAMTIPARVVRVQGCGEQWYEVGAVLLRSEAPLSLRD